MFRIKRTTIGSLLVIAAVAVQLGPVSARAADTTDVFEILSEALSSGDEMIRSAQQDLPDPFLTQAADFSDRVREAMNLVSPDTDEGDQVRGHLQMSLSEAGKAVDAANAGEMDQAADFALNALSHAEEANSLAETLR